MAEGKLRSIPRWAKLRRDGLSLFCCSFPRNLSPPRKGPVWGGGSFVHLSAAPSYHGSMTKGENKCKRVL